MLKQKGNKFKKNFLIKNKKGISLQSEFMVVIIALIIFLVIYLGFQSNAFGKVKDFFGGQIKAVTDDCDKDRINNEFDDCPCLSTGGDGEDRPGFLGCPKGTSYEDQQQDKTTCLSWYVVGGKATADCRTVKGQTACPEKDTNQKEFKTRCDAISATSTVVSETAGRGIKGDWDLAITKLDIQTKEGIVTATPDKEAQVPIDLEGKFDITVPVDFEIKNIGSQDIIDTFSLTYSICDKTKANCKEIKNEAVTISGLKAGMPFSQQKYPIKLGLDGDPCDGPGEISCYVKLTADSGIIFTEKNRLNNEVWFRVVLRNQGFTEYQFKKYLIKASSDHTSDGIIAAYLEFSQPQQPSAEFPSNQELPNALPPGGLCWVMGQDKDYISASDYGAVAVSQGWIIRYDKREKLDTIPPDWLYSHKDALDVIKSGTWKADTKGSLICKEGYWYLCDTRANNKLLPIGDLKFTCEDQIWK